MNNRILVIGDSCKDIFIYGKSTRLCPDAPVPVFVAKQIIENGGMAKNVYSNLVSLGASVDILTNKEEITKTRYIDKKTNHMFLRVDSGEEKISRVEGLENIKFEEYSAIIISDYDKGFLLEKDIEYILQRHSETFIDTKKLLNQWYKNASFIKINKPEFDRTKHLLDVMDNLVITIGSGGCIYRGIVYPVEKVEVLDTVGAGDTFIASLVWKYIENKDIEEAIRFANNCATKVVQKKGVSIINEN